MRQHLGRQQKPVGIVGEHAGGKLRTVGGDGALLLGQHGVSMSSPKAAHTGHCRVGAGRRGRPAARPTPGTPAGCGGCGRPASAACAMLVAGPVVGVRVASPGQQHGLLAAYCRSKLCSKLSPAASAKPALRPAAGTCPSGKFSHKGSVSTPKIVRAWRSSPARTACRAAAENSTRLGVRHRAVAHQHRPHRLPRLPQQRQQPAAAQAPHHRGAE